MTEVVLMRGFTKSKATLLLPVAREVCSFEPPPKYFLKRLGGLEKDSESCEWRFVDKSCVCFLNIMESQLSDRGHKSISFCYWSCMA